jgi:hypothetical protein
MKIAHLIGDRGRIRPLDGYLPLWAGPPAIRPVNPRREPLQDQNVLQHLE